MTQWQQLNVCHVNYKRAAMTLMMTDFILPHGVDYRH